MKILNFFAIITSLLLLIHILPKVKAGEAKHGNTMSIEFVSVLYLSMPSYSVPEKDKTIEKQTIDSLIKIAKEQLNRNLDTCYLVASEALKLAEQTDDQEQLAKASYYLGFAYLYKNEFDKAELAFSKCTEYAEKAESYLLIIYSLIGKAEFYYENNQFDEAKTLLLKAKDLSLEHNITSTYSNIYNNLAKILEIKEGKIPEAIEMYLKSAEILFEEECFEDLAVVYSNIGILHKNLRNYKTAVFYMQKAIQINKAQGLVYNLYENYNNLGIIYSKSDSIEKAEFYYKLCIDQAKKDLNEFQLAKAFLNIAILYNNQKQLKTAKAYFDSSIYYCEKNNLYYGLSVNRLNLGEYYRNIGDFSKAIEILQGEKKRIQSYQMPEMNAALYDYLYVAYKDIGLYDSALIYYEMNHNILDNIYSQQVRDSINVLEKKYLEELNARKTAELQQTIAEKKARNNLYIVLFIIVIISLIFRNIFLRLRRKTTALREKLVIQENQELKNSMELKNQELVSKALLVTNMNSQIEKINEEAEEIMPLLNKQAKSKLKSILKQLDYNISNKIWKEFETHFEHVYAGFSNNLHKLFPDLSPAELKVCCFLRLNMTTKDIAALTNRSIGTVDNIRYNIRKKMDIDADTNLTAFLLDF